MEVTDDKTMTLGSVWPEYIPGLMNPRPVLFTTVLASLAASASLRAQTPPADAPPPAASAPAPGAPALSALLRDALFEEEATRDLTKAAAGYEALLAHWTAQRPTAAAALYRLAEVRRKQDRKADAIALFQRLLREFPDVAPNAELARETLIALGGQDPTAIGPSAVPPPGASPITDEEATALQRVRRLAAESPDLLAGQEFVLACQRGWLSVVQFLVSQNVHDNGDGLADAAMNGHLAIIYELLRLKPDYSLLNRALDQASANGRPAVLRALLDAGASPDGSDPRFPALTEALRNSHEAADVLLAHNARPDPATARISPLLIASQTGNARMVKRLLDLKADPNRSAAMDGEVPLYNDGRDNLVVPRGSTPLHAAAFSGNTEIVKLLIEAKANPNAENDAGWTPLRGAVRYENLSMVEMLLAAGADPNAGNGMALMAAVSSGNLAVTNMLLKAGARPDAVLEGRISALQMAVSGKDLAIARALLEAGADPSLIPDPDQEGRAANQIFHEEIEPRLDAWVALFVKHDPLFLSPGPSLFYAAPDRRRAALFRTHGYPVLADRPGIMLVFCDAAHLSLLAERKTDDEKPGPLPALLTAWHEKGGWDMTFGSLLRIPPDWSTLRLWRKGKDGKMQESGLKVSKATQWPELHWGDVIEIMGDVSKRNSPTGPAKALPPELLEILKLPK